jgi:hypothetical protein
VCRYFISGFCISFGPFLCSFGGLSPSFGSGFGSGFGSLLCSFSGLSPSFSSGFCSLFSGFFFFPN